MKLLFLIIVIVGFWYAWTNNFAPLQKIKVFFGAGYQDVEVENLFSIANLYNGKNVCTKGYYIESTGVNVLKQTFDGDIYNKSMWVVNNSGKKILVNALEDGKGASLKLCGKFESGRGSGFGQPSIWNHQITVQDFELLGKTELLPR